MTLLPQSPVEAILLIVGVAMGILFALDGWSGSPTTRDFATSPRLKNFKYAAFTAGLAFIADLKPLGITVAKDHLLLWYLVGFVLTAVLVIGAVMIVIAVQYPRVAQAYPGLTFPGQTPVLHYLFYGFHSYQAALQKAKEERDASVEKSQAGRSAEYQAFIHRFLPAYNKQVSNSIAGVDRFLAHQEEPVRMQVAQQILTSIQAVVTEYNDRRPGLAINVNYMRAYPFATAPAAAKTRLRFAKKGVTTYGCVLMLTEYADDEGRESFSLPVPDETDQEAAKLLLPGAPEAFFNTTTAVIPQTEKVEFPTGFDPAVKAEIKAYFASKRFQSFASMTIIHRGEKCGVVNIESNAEYVFGRREEEQKELAGLIKPFSLLLGFVVKT